MNYLIKFSARLGEHLSLSQQLFYILFITNFTALYNQLKGDGDTYLVKLYTILMVVLLLGLYVATLVVRNYKHCDTLFSKGISKNFSSFKEFYIHQQEKSYQLRHFFFYLLLIVAITLQGFSLGIDFKSPDKTQEMTDAMNRTEKKTELILGKSEEIKLLIDEKKGLHDSITSLNVIIKEQSLVIDSLKRRK